MRRRWCGGNATRNWCAACCTAQRLKAATLRIERAEAIAWMKRAAPRSLELVLLDPPFDAGLDADALAAALPWWLAAASFMSNPARRWGRRAPLGRRTAEGAGAVPVSSCLRRQEGDGYTAPAATPARRGA